MNTRQCALWLYIAGDVLYSKVYAVDNVNTKSKIAVSNGVTIDKTSPQPQYLFHSGENIAINPLKTQLNFYQLIKSTRQTFVHWNPTFIQECGI